MTNGRIGTRECRAALRGTGRPVRAVPLRSNGDTVRLRAPHFFSGREASRALFLRELRVGTAVRRDVRAMRRKAADPEKIDGFFSTFARKNVTLENIW